MDTISPSKVDLPPRVHFSARLRGYRVWRSDRPFGRLSVHLTTLECLMTHSDCSDVTSLKIKTYIFLYITKYIAIIMHSMIYCYAQTHRIKKGKNTCTDVETLRICFSTMSVDECFSSCSLFWWNDSISSGEK